MENENSSTSLIDWKQVICPIRCDSLLNENHSHLSEFMQYCSTRLISPVVYSDKKEIHLQGNRIAILEAEKRLLEIQNELLVENKRKKLTEDIHWFYEAWDATWQLYDSKMINEIEHNYQSKQFNFTMQNTIGEKLRIDLDKSLEIYGTRIKRMRRTKIDEQLPNYWTITPLSRSQFVLDVESMEYNWIKNSFDKTMNTRYRTMISIERIQNVSLFKQFRVSHDDFVVRYNQDVDGTMRYLYHGCPHLASKRIIERGFNRSFAGVHGCVFGRGVYFSTDASYSDRYAEPNNQNEKRIFFTRVLVGRSMIGNPKIYEPDDGFDTTTNGTHIFVCYHDSQCYPEYLLTYM